MLQNIFIKATEAGEKAEDGDGDGDLSQRTPSRCVDDNNNINKAMNLWARAQRTSSWILINPKPKVDADR